MTDFNENKNIQLGIIWAFQQYIVYDGNLHGLGAFLTHQASKQARKQANIQTRSQLNFSIVLANPCDPLGHDLILFKT